MSINTLTNYRNDKSMLFSIFLTILSANKGALININSSNTTN